MSIENLDKEICVGCKICNDVCPEDVLRYNETEKKAFIAYREDCCACWVCEWYCPVKCITVSRDPTRPIVMDY